MANILVCEDEAAIREFIVLNLEKKGYGVIAVGSGEEAINEFKKHQQQLKVVLLDIMMNGINGREVCKYIRRRDENIGIIMISALGQEINKVGSVMEGAVDYITKPFGMMEFVARVKAVLRRCSKQEDDKELRYGDLSLSVGKHKVHWKDTSVELTRKEFELLQYLMENKGLVMSRNQILCHVWGYDCLLYTSDAADE